MNVVMAKHILPTTTLVVGALAGVVMGRYLLQTPNPSSPSSTPTSVKAAEEVLSSKIANFQGQIVTVNTNTIEVKDADGNIATFTIAPEATFINPKTRTVSTVSSELKNIQPGTNVYMVLRADKETYYISSITPLLPTPSKTPVATSSSKPKP